MLIQDARTIDLIKQNFAGAKLVRGCSPGVVVLVYLTSLIHKFNGVMRKEVALKEECSRWVCSALGAVAAIQVIGVLGLLYKQQLWTNLYLMPTTVDGVRLFCDFSKRCMVHMLAFANDAQMCLQLWSCLFKVAIVDALIRTLGFILKSMVLLLHPAQPEENNRRRSQVQPLPIVLFRWMAVSCWSVFPLNWGDEPGVSGSFMLELK